MNKKKIVYQGFEIDIEKVCPRMAKSPKRTKVRMYDKTINPYKKKDFKYTKKYHGK